MLLYLHSSGQVLGLAESPFGIEHGLRVGMQSLQVGTRLWVL